jgi:hypothetical protein
MSEFLRLGSFANQITKRVKRLTTGGVVRRADANFSRVREQYTNDQSITGRFYNI